MKGRTDTRSELADASLGEEPHRPAEEVAVSAGDRPDVGIDRGERPAEVLVGQEVVAAAEQVVIDPGDVRPPGVDSRRYPAWLAIHHASGPDVRGSPGARRGSLAGSWITVPRHLAQGPACRPCNTFRDCTLSQGTGNGGRTAVAGRMAGQRPPRRRESSGAAPLRAAELERATSLYAAGLGPGDTHACTLEALACTELAAARLRAGRVESAVAAAEPVLALPSGKRIPSLPQRLGASNGTGRRQLPGLRGGGGARRSASRRSSATRPSATGEPDQAASTGPGRSAARTISARTTRTATARPPQAAA